MNRRRFVRDLTAAWAGLLYAPRAAVTWRRPRFSAYPFTLGVASGDPAPDGVVLWTRLAPDPLRGGGMPPESLNVEWVVAEDELLRRVVRRGAATAGPELGHSVHVEVDGLEPGRPYWYQFFAGAEASPVGRTRTTPPRDAKPDRLRFAFASCQHYEQGFYTAHRHLAAEDLDLVVHLGDYIYEYGGALDRVRYHTYSEIESLDDYRNRYALYQSDPDLQAAHAAFPWIVTWDDHEVDNNYAGAISERGDPVEAFLRRRASAYQAYYEHLPLRRGSLPRGPDLPLSRRLAFGELADFHVLDGRQYRSDQACGDGVKARCPEAEAPERTMLGAAQEAWLQAGLDRSRARWNVLANQTVIAQLDSAPGDERQFSMDNWNGYPAARRRLLEFLARRRPANPVVITGDIHSNWVADLKTDFDDPRSPTVAAEFVGTSISSGGDGADLTAFGERGLAENPHIKFFNGQRGYVRCEVTPERWRADYRVVEFVTQPHAPIKTRAGFVVENGRPGVVPA